jgi:hypothetical protein
MDLMDSHIRVSRKVHAEINLLLSHDEDLHTINQGHLEGYRVVNKDS